MNKIDTLSMIAALGRNPKLRFETTLNGKTLEVYVNQNGGISTRNERNTVTLSGDIMLAKWERVEEKYTFMQAINSNKKIKHESWKDYFSFEEALYELLEAPISNARHLINSGWNIEE